jgi:signal peptidase I
MKTNDRNAAAPAELSEEAGAQTTGIRSEAWEWIKSIAVALAIVLVVHTFVFNLSTVKGNSMRPTLEDGEWLFINKIGFLLGKPDRGDIVILKDPQGALGFREYLVKRVVALPGETVEARNGLLYVDGHEVSEPYTEVPIEDGDFGPVKVPEGHYFVMGDNRHRAASTDSRSFSTVPEDLIKGKAQFVLWPIGKIGGLYAETPEVLP